ncbi:beta-galactosidase [Paenibacillus sonchi]|uniref:Beta-galactosidase n=1 Tax=Paenibacillus sonchi TaxID=373687 RepID=A0A974SCN1_9BACL|nr:beta-galactosidase [Paenibacillus sonchi]QQZ61047.1 beta-galactosidase [Paenibacillus sonchi]
MSLSLAGTFCNVPEGIRILTVAEDHFQMETASDGGGAALDISQYAPDIWNGYEYLTADIYHECHDVLVIIFKFQDTDGRAISVHYGVLPHVTTRLCFPLAALNGEKLFLERFPGVLQSVLRGDSFVDRSRIDGLSICTIPSVSARKFEVSGLRLTQSVPDFTYEPKPYVDGLGQLSWKEWQGKTRSAGEMASALHGELAQMRPDADSNGLTSPFGGWKSLRFPATGFFRTEFDGSNWWFVDPDGYALFSAGMDCIGPSSEMQVTGMEHLLPVLPDREGPYKEAWSGHGYSPFIANLIRAFGESWREDWRELTERRLKAWGINTAGNWSDPDFIAGSKLPYVYPMQSFPSTNAVIYRDFPDVFSHEYEEKALEFARQLAAFKEDKRLVGYFMRNEPQWAFVDGLNLTEEMLRSPVPFVSKYRLIAWLEDKYASVGRWNAAWGTSFDSFQDLLDNEKAASGGNEARRNDCTLFNRLMIRRYTEIPARACREADPHHLNLGMRYAWISNEDLLEGCEAFDVFSINCYQLQPDRELIGRISKRLKRPVMIGEYHFGAADAGLPAYGIRAVATQQDRGLAYRYYVEQAAAIPELIGVHYFQLNDQTVLGRFDGENYQIGVVDVCQRPYQAFVEQMKMAHRNMYEVRTGRIDPFTQAPEEIPKTGF